MNQQLLEKVLRCPRLPSLPAVAVEVIEQCRRDDSNVKQIAATISNDPALSSKILKTVNSSFYGLREPIGTISHALVILGLNSVKTLALGFSLVSNFKDIGGEDFGVDQIWRRSLYSAVAARAISQRVDGVEHEQAFLGGLMQDLGMIALLQTLRDDYVPLVEQAGDRHDALWRIERKQLDLDHAQVGQALAERWRLPEELIAPIRYHEQPDRAPRQQQTMVRAVTLGGRAADVFLRQQRNEAVGTYFGKARDWFRMDQNAGSELLQTIKTGTREMSKLLEINAGAPQEPEQILSEAQEALLELSLKTQQENEQLQQKATTDPLTGAANRGHFSEFLTRQFEQAQRQTQPVALVLMDADKFKAVNDTHGHVAGDQVLIAIASVLKERAPEGAVVARYGGEEFAVVLPGVNRRDAAQQAETFRSTIEATPIDAGEGLTLNVTASIGVAAFDGVRFFKRAEQLIKAADQAVYAAKEAGRNCVRVFAPKVKTPSQKSNQPAAPTG